MTENSNSLVAQIFGGSNTNPKKQKNDGTETKHTSHNSLLSSLFEATTRSSLPDKPNNLTFVEIKKKSNKRKKAKNVEDNTDENVADGIKEKKQKADDSNESNGDNSEGESNTKNNEEGDDNDDELKIEDEDLTIFVGNLPFNTTRRSLAVMFKSCGKVRSARLRSIATEGVKVTQDHAGNQNLVKKISVNTNKVLEDNPKKTAQGYVVFDTIEAVEAALKMNNSLIPGSDDGLRLRVDRSKPTLDSSRSVFIGNLPYTADEMSLRDHIFNGCGWSSTSDVDVIEGVRIVRDPSTMKCKGFGYVLLKDKSFVPEVLKLHESEYLKRNIRVLVCGKRFKGRKGNAPPNADPKSATGASRRILTKLGESAISKVNNKKKRGVKKPGIAKKNSNGLSKRASSDKKVDKRVKKLQKRISKGMGKARKKQSS